MGTCFVLPFRRVRKGWVRQIFQKNIFGLKLSGDEVYCANALLLLIRSCGAVHFIARSFKLKLFPHQIVKRRKMLEETTGAGTKPAKARNLGAPAKARKLGAQAPNLPAKNASSTVSRRDDLETLNPGLRTL